MSISTNESAVGFGNVSVDGSCHVEGKRGNPESPFMAGHEEGVEANLDYLIDTQRPDGSWMPTWNWSDAYPVAWELARREWSGVITLGNLLILRRFGRIDGGER